MIEATVDIDGKSKDKAVPLGMKNGLASQWLQSTPTLEGTRSKKCSHAAALSKKRACSQLLGKSVLMARD